MQIFRINHMIYSIIMRLQVLAITTNDYGMGHLEKGIIDPQQGTPRRDTR